MINTLINPKILKSGTVAQQVENTPDYGTQGRQDKNKPATAEESKVPRLQN